jgi:hypothetical protein
MLAGGAAFMALWLLVRFPEWSPTRPGRAVWHFAVSLVCVWTTGDLIEPLAAKGTLAGLAAVFALVLPALVYSWFAVASILVLVDEGGRA